MDKKFTEYVESVPEGDALVEVWQDPVTEKYGYRIMRDDRRVIGFESEYESVALALEDAAKWLRAETQSLLTMAAFLVFVGTVIGVLIYGSVILTGVEFRCAALGMMSVLTSGLIVAVVLEKDHA